MTPRLVALTGGPGAGKTTVLERARELFAADESVIVLPEAASILYRGGFLRRDSLPARRARQRAIFAVQRAHEQMFLDEGLARIILCDRGTLDGFAFWPEAPDGFWAATGTTRESELARYATVIHLRTPGETGYNHENPLRVETADLAAALDRKLEAAWQGHPNRIFVEPMPDFGAKARFALELIRREIENGD